jgi:hypothetical protein
MFTRFAGAIAVVLVGSFALAETVRGVITEVKDDEIAVTVFKKKGKKGGEKKTFKIDAKKVKVEKVKGKDDSEASTLAALKKAIEDRKDSKFPGVFATIEVDDGKATEIKYRTGFGKKKKKKTDD